MRIYHYMKLQGAVHVWLALYLVACGFQSILVLPFVGDKIQIPEMIFVVLLMVILRQQGLEFLQKVKRFKDQTSLWILPLLWLFIHIGSLIFNQSLEGWLECIGVFYLLMVFITLLLLLSSMDFSNRIEFWFNCQLSLGWLMSITALIGYVFSWLFSSNLTAQVFFGYPYFGDVLRLQGFTTTPAMYVSIITVPIATCLWYHRQMKGGNGLVWSALFFTAVATLSFSKSMIFIGWVWLVWIIHPFNRKTLLIWFLAFALFLIHLFFTHFLWVSNETLLHSDFSNSPYSSDEVIWKGEHHSLLGSGYYSFKQTAWKIFRNHPWVGIGPGQYNKAVDQLKAAGQYPLHLASYDPHCSFLGALATLGLAGGILFCLIWFLFLRKIQFAVNQSKLKIRNYLFLLTSIILFESVSMDVMNFRHYWIFAAFAIACTGNHTNERS